MRLGHKKEVSPPDLPISKSMPFRVLYFLKRAKAPFETYARAQENKRSLDGKLNTTKKIVKFYNHF